MKWLKDLILSTSKNSSKRAIALFTCVLMAIAHAPIILSGDISSILMLIGSDMGFICTLLGIASYQNNIKERINGNSKEGSDLP